LLHLDLLRAIACILVLAQHKQWLPHQPEWGWLGVHLFFVLSGYLVSGLLLAEYRRHGSLRPGRFLLRRGLKLYPQYYLLLAVSVPALMGLGSPVDGSRVLGNLLFVQNYAPHLDHLHHTWSLAVEEHFYIGLALWLGWLARRSVPDPFRCLPIITITVAGLCLAGRITTFAMHPYTLQTHLFPTHLRVDALLLGASLAYCQHFRPEQFARVLARRRTLAVAATGLLLPSLALPVEHPVNYTLGLTTAMIGCAAVLLLALSYAEAGKASPLTRGLGYAGSFSYGIYVWHPWLVWITHVAFAGRFPTLEVATYFVLAIGTGIAVTRLVELPILWWRDRWLPSRA
jgi:peptidoglycan/LPS O-acetylase OafA/YrhL